MLSSVQTVIEFAPIARLGVKVSVLALAETSLASVWLGVTVAPMTSPSIAFLALIARLGCRRKNCGRDRKQKHCYFLVAQSCHRSLRSLHGASMLLVAGSIKPDREPTPGLRFANATKVTGLSVYFVYLSIFKTLRISRYVVRDIVG